MSLKGAVEAALFATGGPIPLKDLAQVVGSPPEVVEEMLVTLRGEFKQRDGGLEVIRHAGGIWALQVNQQYTTLVHRLVPPDLELPLMKTLSLIALLQPVSQAKIVEHRGQGAYTHVKDLVKKGFIEREKDGNSYTLSTTPEFARRFRLKDDPEAIRQALQERATDPTVSVLPEIEPVAEPQPDLVEGLLAVVGEAAEALAADGVLAPATVPGEPAEPAANPEPAPEPNAVAEAAAPAAFACAEPAAADAAPADPAPAEAAPADAAPADAVPPPTDAPPEEAESVGSVTRLSDHRSMRHRILEGREKIAWPARRARR